MNTILNVPSDFAGDQGDLEEFTRNSIASMHAWRTMPKEMRDSLLVVLNKGWKRWHLVPAYQTVIFRWMETLGVKEEEIMFAMCTVVKVVDSLGVDNPFDAIQIGRDVFNGAKIGGKRIDAVHDFMHDVLIIYTETDKDWERPYPIASCDSRDGEETVWVWLDGEDALNYIEKYTDVI